MLTSVFESSLGEVNHCVSTPQVVVLSLGHKNISIFHQLLQVKPRSLLCSIYSAQELYVKPQHDHDSDLHLNNMASVCQRGLSCSTYHGWSTLRVPEISFWAEIFRSLKIMLCKASAFLDTVTTAGLPGWSSSSVLKCPVLNQATQFLTALNGAFVPW
jgi:hypothetical protein